MLNGNFRKRLFSAVLLGILTIFFCLVLADGIIGMEAWDFYGRDELILPGRIFFFVCIIGLPVLFSIWTRPQYTLINLPLYYILFFPINAFFSNVNLFRDRYLTHFFMNQSGFDLTPDWVDALITALTFFVIEFFVMSVVCLIRFAWRKIRGK